MYELTLLSLPECMAALNAMLKTSEQIASKQPCAIAIVNEHGEIMAYARMDGATVSSQQFAIKKAYTSAKMGSDLKDFRAGLEQRGRTVSDYSDPNLVGMAAGGVAVRAPNRVLVGGIGVAGGTPDEDEQIARVGLQAITGKE